MLNQIKTRRNEGEAGSQTRVEFDKAYTDLSDLLPCYAAKYHYKVFVSYLGANSLLIGKDAAKGRLLVTLNMGNL